MKRIAFLLVAVTTVVGVVALMAPHLAAPLMTPS
jgi:hypothetical protein